MLKLAIVGLGWWGRHIVSTLQGRSSKLRFLYAVDLDMKGIDNFASQHNLVCLEKFEDLLPKQDLDAIVLATPHSLHEAQIVEAARSGKHVFCEKPLALNREGAKNAIDTCEISGVTLGVGHERRFEPAMKKIKSMIDRGELGKIMHVESNFSHDKLANLPSNNWRVSNKESPAAGMTATGIHLTDAYLNMFGDIKTVYAQVATRNVANRNGDVISLQLKFKSGATGSFSSVLETPLYMRYCVFGSRAWVEAKDFHHPSEKGPTFFSFCEKEGVIETETFEWEDTVQSNFEAFADACLGGVPYPFSAHEKLQNIAVFEAICRSTETGLPENVLI